MSAPASAWQLKSGHAKLRLPNFQAELHLDQLQAGVQNIVHSGRTLPTNVLGIAQLSACEEVLIRGNDLIASFPESSSRPFSLHVYWRATVDDESVVLLDSILSLQTRQWESYPQVTLVSSFAAENCWFVSKTEAAEIRARETPEPWPTGCLLARLADSDLSYAEMVPPTDGHNWQLSPRDSRQSLYRTFGGAFLERGVIRRLRIRAAFLPRQNDVPLAREILQRLINAEPPLMA